MAAADILLWLGDDPPPVDNAIAVHARCDLPERAAVPAGRVAVSAAEEIGLDGLWLELERRAAALVPRLDETVLNRRQSDLIAAAARHVEAASRATDPLILAEELRAARLAFDRVTGRADTEAMLDALFGRFCIGK
jgi:tRNA modification GTPase